MLCNAEDWRCMVEKHSEDLCAECCVLMCCSCTKALRSSPPVTPVRALANNLWRGFAAPMLAAEKVIVHTVIIEDIQESSENRSSI